MKFSALEYMQRPLNFAIVDEVDSILIDEARTPLIISGAADAASEKYRTLNEIVTKLIKDEHYNVDEKGFSAALTDEGVETVQRLVGIDNLYDPVNVQSLHILNQLLRAHALYKRDQHYMVSSDGKVLIIDEFTGRVLAGRRWSDGLHQAVEAKENVRIQEESRTMATITFQNLFRLYKKLAGMTGTAETEAHEFSETYKLMVTAIPTNKPNIRQDDHDVVYKTEREKFNALTRDILSHHEEGRPVLVGTTSVEKSDAIARILKKKKIPHSVLNAKHHQNEASIVAQAGQKGAITVSTNMAGRGTDIMLGGNAEMIATAQFKEAGKTPETHPEEYAALLAEVQAKCKVEHDVVTELGGLYIIGTERHESRRIDNQLRGRAGRQGDPGYSKFYLSLEDDLMRIFAGDRVKNLMDRMGMPDDEPIEHPLVSRSIENAQRKVEERNFDIRKNLLEYDDVMNAQRKTVYTLRQQLLLGRYAPEEHDENGKSTGEIRTIPVDEKIAERSRPLVAQLIGMYCDPPLQPTGEDGKYRAPTQEELEKAGTLVELRSLQTDAYHTWGVKLDLETRRERTPISVYDELVELVPHGLSEQRERVLDLLDRVVGAMVEENCPPNKQAEDWDWKGIHQGFKEHFRVDPDAEHQRDRRRRFLGARAVSLRRSGLPGEGTGNRAGNAAARLPPPVRGEHRRSVGRAPVQHGASARRHRPARLRPARSQERVQERGLQPVLEHDGEDLEHRARAPVRGTPASPRRDRRHRGRGRSALPRRAGSRRRASSGRRPIRLRRPRRCRFKRAVPRRPRPRSVATTCARAARARSSRSATARSWKRRAPSTTTRPRTRRPTCDRSLEPHQRLRHRGRGA